MGLWLTFLLGIFMILGAIIAFYTDESEKFVEFSIALATGVIFMLILLDLIPEVMEVVPYRGIFKGFAIFSGIAFGFVLLLVLDKFVPNHEEDEKDITDDDQNLGHIGLVSSIALFVHNMVEGIAIYMLSMQDVKAAFMASVGVGLHNLPLGMVIASAIYQQNKDKKKTMTLISFVALSTFMGGLLVFLFPVANYIEILEAISLTLTIGMLLFILFMELVPKMRKTKNTKVSFAGFFMGVVLLIISSLL